MIKKISHKNKFYFVTSADWESIVHCSSSSEAANSAVEGVLKKYGKQAKLDPAVIVFDLGKYGSLGDADIATEIFYTPAVLADIGMHSLSKKVDVMMQTLPSNSSSWDFLDKPIDPEEMPPDSE